MGSLAGGKSPHRRTDAEDRPEGCGQSGTSGERRLVSGYRFTTAKSAALHRTDTESTGDTPGRVARCTAGRADVRSRRMAEQSKTVDTALTLLRLVADRQGATTASLARDLAQSRSAVGRMLVTLESHGLARARRTAGWRGRAAGAGRRSRAELRVLARIQARCTGREVRRDRGAERPRRRRGGSGRPGDRPRRRAAGQLPHRDPPPADRGRQRPVPFSIPAPASWCPRASSSRGSVACRGRGGDGRPADREPGRRGPGPSVPARRRGGRRARAAAQHRRRPGRERLARPGATRRERTPCRTTDTSVRCRPAAHPVPRPTGASTPRS